MNELERLMKKVIDYHEGKGEYNFSNLKQYQRNNAAFDAWHQLYREIKITLEKDLCQK